MSQQSALFDPEFTITVGGGDITPLCVSWELNDVEDGISSLSCTFGNPDLKYSGQCQKGQEATIRVGNQGAVTMEITDVKEKYPTTSAPTIRFTALDCTHKLLGATFAGNSKENPKIQELIKSLMKDANIKPQVEIKEPEKKPQQMPLHNMNAHAAIRWMMGKTDCKQGGGGGGNSPIKDAPKATAGPEFPKADATPGDRGIEHNLDDKLKELPKFQANSKMKKAGSTVITGSLKTVGYYGLKAKKCVTVENVGPAASGKWYVRKCTHSWHVGHGYTTKCTLLRGTVGKDGKSIDQPVVMYADIYEKNKVYVGCRKIDGESQATFTYGDGSWVMDFEYAIKLQRGRNAGEQAKSAGLLINKAGSTDQSKSDKDGQWSSSGGGGFNL